MDIGSGFVQNNIALIITAIMSGCMLLWAMISGRVGKEINTVVAVQMINYKDAMVLDVREESEYRKGHIAGSKHIPADRVEERVAELEKFKSNPVVVVDREGISSGKPGAVLRKNGFAHVHNLFGGFEAWQRANLPVVKK